MSYKDYLKSEHWQKQRRRTIGYGGKECYICKKRGKLHIHHKTYKRIGHENIQTDLFALCPQHHLEVHKIEKELRPKGWNVWNATVKVKKDYSEKNGFKWGIRETRDYWKTVNDDKFDIRKVRGY